MEHEDLTKKIISAAIAVHRALGPGFIESVYEKAIGVELRANGINFARQVETEIFYREVSVGRHRLDLLVEDTVVVELKAVLEVQDIHLAILRSYLLATRKSVGLLLNFAASTLQPRRIGPNLPKRPGSI